MSKKNPETNPTLPQGFELKTETKDVFDERSLSTFKYVFNYETGVVEKRCDMSWDEEPKWETVDKGTVTVTELKDEPGVFERTTKFPGKLYEIVEHLKPEEEAWKHAYFVQERHEDGSPSIIVK